MKYFASILEKTLTAVVKQMANTVPLLAESIGLKSKTSGI